MEISFGAHTKRSETKWFCETVEWARLCMRNGARDGDTGNSVKYDVVEIRKHPSQMRPHAHRVCIACTAVCGCAPRNVPPLVPVSVHLNAFLGHSISSNVPEMHLETLTVAGTSTLQTHQNVKCISSVSVHVTMHEQTSVEQKPSCASRCALGVIRRVLERSPSDTLHNYGANNSNIVTAHGIYVYNCTCSPYSAARKFYLRRLVRIILIDDHGEDDRSIKINSFSLKWNYFLHSMTMTV